MSTLLEITGDEIALLNDTDLRSLIGKLCEADFRLAGLPTTGIIWGGHQNAGDGGMDVMVHSEVAPPPNSFVPRMQTGFQVKKPDMPPAKIDEEMRPEKNKKNLREKIKALSRAGGAYIIVSSKASTTETAMENRVKAMRQAVADEPNHPQLLLDFFDRGRIATWVRCHPSLILWVRNQIGRPLQGWKPYDNWANPSAGLQEVYIVDEAVRLYDGTNPEQGASVMDGLQKLRVCLSQNGTSVRLTGLSGVGKTRFVQALFDERIGQMALNQSLAYYTDMSDGPIPDPISFASQLIAQQTKAVLIIDNCSPELHRTLTKTCQDSMVSLLTVEYDIQDDIPEETSVFRLEPSSNDLIEKLLKQRYPHISPMNAQTIAEFADGNARVAIALANTLPQGDSLSTLRDTDLFKRLFYQRQEQDKSLKISAEICSLVYSFQGDDITPETSELAFLANLAKKPLQELYRDIAELKKRGLVQARSVWRAVLPHAIANRLAKDALNFIPSQDIVYAFLSSRSERLIKSFSRRLGYLHDSQPAMDIAQEWLKPDGLIGATNGNFSDVGLAVFENIAPILPEATLIFLECVANESPDGLASLHSYKFIHLLRHLAYDAELFPRSTHLLSRLALLEKPDINNGGSARSTLSNLFHIHLSGTHAPAQTRATMIERLLYSTVPDEQALAINLLQATLKSRGFMTYHIGTFGARPRDLGYYPPTNQEVVNWYRIFLALCTQTALSDKPIAKQAKGILADHLRDLWSIGVDFDQGFLDELEHAILQIHHQKPWNEGWISIKEILHYDSEMMAQEALLKLKQLAQSLRPVRLLEQARAYALTNGDLDFGLADDFNKDDDPLAQWEWVQSKTRQIGVAVAQDKAVFEELLPELVSNYYPRLWVFGEGLGEGCEDQRSMWQMLYAQMAQTLPEKRQITVMLGFLSTCALHEANLYDAILDSLLEDKLLGQWFPYFQMTSTMDKKGVERFHKALDAGISPIGHFEQLAWGRKHEAINDNDLAGLLQKIAAKEGGVKVAIQILWMRFHREKGANSTYSQNLIAISRDVLSQYLYGENRDQNRSLDYELAQIVDVSFQGSEAMPFAKELCQHLAQAFQDYRIYSTLYPHLLGKLAEIQPEIFLDTFIGFDKYLFRWTAFDNLERIKNPVNQIPENRLIDWCEREPEIRYPLLVASMQMYFKPKEVEALSWHPIFWTILEKAPNLPNVLAQLENDFYPMSWSGSRAEARAKRLPLFAQLFEYPNPTVQEWAMAQHQKLERAVEAERKQELKESQERFERFE